MPAIHHTQRWVAAQTSIVTGRLGGPRFAGALLLDSLGSGVVMPLAVLFFTIHKHMAPTTVGLGITIGGGASLLLAPLAGHLIDALRPKRAMLTMWALAAVSAAAWLLVHNLWELALVQGFTNFSSGAAWNAGTALLAELSDSSDLSNVMATNYSLRNFGFGAGGLLATLALAVGGVGFDIAVLVNVASYVGGGLLTAGVHEPDRPPHDPQVTDDTTIWTVLRDTRYVALALLQALIAFNQAGLQVILPLWVVLKTHAPPEIVGLMFTLNTALVVTSQLRVAATVRELRDTSRAYRRAAVLMIASALAYLGSHYVGNVAAIILIVAGTLLLTGTEMFSSACAFLVSIQLADERHRGKYLSVFGIGWGVENTAGPLVSTSLVSAGVLFPWPAVAAVVAVGAIGSSAIVRRAAPRSVVSGPQAADNAADLSGA